mmetsp:Transcript_44954/g.106754  ORF Transcript_44954/g.106754 Transcript_44954/m.106754 type:complete len:365 (+) Transcript_44954:119-1213(+)
MQPDASSQHGRGHTPPRSAVVPIRILKICLNDNVLGGVEVNEGSTLADVRSSIVEDDIPGVPESYLFLFGGAPVSRRQEGRRRAMDCFPFLTIIPENARVLPHYVVSGGQPGLIETEAGPDVMQLHQREYGDDAGVGGGGGASSAGVAAAAHSDLLLELQITDGPLEGTTVTIGGEGARVGRHTSNTLVVPEERISRYHFEISRNSVDFCVRDLGSTTGTFFYLKPNSPFQMFVGLMVKLGETEFQVVDQSCSRRDAEPEQVVLFYAGPLAGHKVHIPGAGISIGRRHNNSLVLVQDGTVSAHHATIHFEDGEFFLTDLGSCNGTCVRLSVEREESDWHPIMDGDFLGAGCTKIKCRTLSGPSS